MFELEGHGVPAVPTATSRLMSGQKQPLFFGTVLLITQTSLRLEEEPEADEGAL